jgi:hypothetical protein
MPEITRSGFTSKPRSATFRYETIMYSKKVPHFFKKFDKLPTSPFAKYPGVLKLGNREVDCYSGLTTIS